MADLVNNHRNPRAEMREHVERGSPDYLTLPTLRPELYDMSFTTKPMTHKAKSFDHLAIHLAISVRHHVFWKQCYTMLYNAIQYYTMVHNVAQGYTRLHNDIHRYTILFNIAIHNALYAKPVPNIV
jgi:hypothetical protein